MNLPVDTLSDEIEPYLLREQFIVRTPAGRKATARAYQVLGRPMEPAPESQKLTDEEKVDSSSPEEPVEDRPTDLFGNAIPWTSLARRSARRRGERRGKQCPSTRSTSPTASVTSSSDEIEPYLFRQAPEVVRLDREQKPPIQPRTRSRRTCLTWIDKDRGGCLNCRRCGS